MAEKGGQKEPKPQFFDLSKDDDIKGLERLLADNENIRTIDTYDDQLKEYFVLQNPWLHLNHEQRDEQFKDYRIKHYGNKSELQAGKWAYLPWRHTLLHLLDDEMYQEVRTGRNRNLITKEEQKKYYQSTVSIAGLSVGNSCALAIVLTGGAKHLRLADPDRLELTNLNRIRGSIAEITEPKVYMTARQIYELDPYADLVLYTEGITENNIEKFVGGADVVVDEMDNIGMKVRLRQEAKKRKIPVVMAADNGDGGILDVERHDQHDGIDYFHGRAGKDIADRVVGKKLPLPAIGQIITEDLLGADIIASRMKKSLLEIGSTLPTWPQLGGAAVLSGVAVGAAVRNIVTDRPLIDNRALLSLESWLVPNYDDQDQVEQRKKETAQFLKNFHERLSQAPSAN